MVDGLTGKGRPLLNPLQGLRGGDRARRLPYYGYKELLQDLRRSAEVRRFNKLHGAFLLGFVFARTYCRVDQDVGVEERVNGHANPLESSFSCRAALEIAHSTDAIAPGRAWPDPGALRDRSSTDAAER